MEKVDAVSLSEKVMNNNLNDKDKEAILKILKEYFLQKEYENKAIEQNKETVFGKR